jgi:DNA adenine methylase
MSLPFAVTQEVRPMVPSPIKWQGGKARLRRIILPRIPEHICYVEPFFGAGWVFFAKPKSKVEVIADVNTELMNFFSVVKSDVEGFLQQFDWTLYSREEFVHIMERRGLERDPLTRAYDFFYRIQSHFGGKYNNAIDWGYGRGKPAFDFGGIRPRMELAHERLRGVYIENRPFHDVIPRFDGPDTFFYCDPPYFDLTGYHQHPFTKEDHLRLRDTLASVQGKWLLSINDHPEVRHWYADFPMDAVDVLYSISRQKSGRKCGELLISNYALPTNHEEGVAP